VRPPGDAGERSADLASAAVMRGQRPHIGAPVPVGLQRQPLPGAGPLSPTPGGDTLLDSADPLLARAVGSTNLEGFVTGQAALCPEHETELRRTAHAIVVFLGRFPLSTVRVIGHTDTVGPKPYNTTLGMERARTVRDALVKLGVPEMSIVIESRGEGPPHAVPTRDEVANPHNRNVEVYFEPETLFVDRAPRPSLLRPPPSTLEPQHDLDLHYRPDPPGPLPGPLVTPIQLPPPTRHLWDFLPSIPFDLATGVNANGPPGSSPNTYTVTAVWRNLNLRAGNEHGAVALDLGHEPNLAVMLSPDPQNRAIYQAAVSVLNLHLRLHGDELIEASLAAQAALAQPSGTRTIGAQLQIELHLNTRFSLTLSSSVAGTPHDPSAPPDRGSIPLGTRSGLDWSWAPISAGFLIHFDPPYAH
jgi:outer membrane protein OmpA-like peptidoglycan-associated protein